MAGLVKEQRSQSWNVRLFIDSNRIAGVYQRDDLLRITDIAYELELCLIFNKPAEAMAWKPALLPVTASRSLIILDRQDERPFPTPVPDATDDYNYVFHSPQCARRDPHSLQDPCIHCPERPTRRVDPRYLEIGKQSQDSISIAPVRKKRQSISSSIVSCNSSPSPIKTEDLDEVCLPRSEVISSERARPIIDTFRATILAAGNTCVITDRGKPWSFSVAAGTGLEAAHVVPQIHWNTYPVDNNGRVAKTDRELSVAWLSTWAVGNGLLMMSHLHKCFNLRLFSIHPTRHTVRAFVDYDLLIDYYGKKVKLPKDIDKRALQYHWDMCCLENTPASTVDFDSGTLSNIPELPKPLRSSNISLGDPSKGVAPQASDKQASDAQASDTHNASQALPDLQTFRLTSFMASDATPCPSSPPPSEPALEGHSGYRVIKDPALAEELRKQGWNVVRINKSDTKDSDEKCGRGRSIEKRRCVATEEEAEGDSDEGSRDGMHRRKKQRLE
ncbi:hypothetical protein VM1G_09062 [Cytospora mali]|uniref:HNH nuclease domain-containing protein n=1 Tax=Cytospora mali TaxID=578113 RepID=A0A194WAB3_CYTMA|nr:hypothetical protein VM1G_09062 [Valsa mali]